MKSNEKKIRKNERRNGYFNFGALVLIVLSLFMAAGCGDSATDRAADVGGVTARQIIENPAAYTGKIVTVTGEVEEIFGPRAFEMDSGLSVGELLVIGRDPYPNIPEAGNRAYVVGDSATVTGMVMMLMTAEIEREIGWDLTPQIEAEYSGKPVLVAQNVLFKPGAAGANTAVPANTANINGAVNTGNANLGANAAGTGDVTDVAVIINAPDRTNLVGRRVNISKVQVQSVIGDRVFIVGPDATKGLPVVIIQEPTPKTPTEGLVDINPGQTISLRGEIMRMPSQEAANSQFNGLLTQKELSSFANHQIYLRSDSNSIDILQRP